MIGVCAASRTHGGQDRSPQLKQIGLQHSDDWVRSRTMVRLKSPAAHKQRVREAGALQLQYRRSMRLACSAATMHLIQYM